MFARFVLGTVTAGAMIMPALAGTMTADEARKFVAGKVFAFTCFDGTRGAGRLLDDMGAAGAVQFNGSVSGMGFAYCEFHHQGGTQMLLARAVARPRARSADASHAEVTARAERVETPRVESGKLDPVAPAEPAKAETLKIEPAKSEGALELRRSAD